MPLELQEPTFDRPFEEIYKELRDRITRYNPAWTNFNESDPGITLLQLFAWLAEMTLHRMNDVPRKNYLKFAKLLGLQLQPARPATVHLSFTPKASEPPATIKASSRYSAQVESVPPVIFETIRPIDVIGAPLAAILVFADGTISKIEAPTGFEKPQSFYPLGRNPEIGNALYLGFKPNPNISKPFPPKMTFLALLPQADTNGVPQRVGEEGQNLVPPVDLAWEYRPKKDQDTWERLNLFSDETVAFTRDGYIDVEGPQDIEPSVDVGIRTVVADPHYWLRVRLDQNVYPVGRAPRLEHFLPNSVDAINLTTEQEEFLGTSNGRAEQSFEFREHPVDPDSLVIAVQSGEVSQMWERQEDFFHSKPTDEHFALDAAAGRVTFGDGMSGEIPTAGAEIIAKVWRHGGGAVGNRVGPGAVKTMVTQVAGIEKVTNVRPATGGADEEALADFIKQAPRHLRSGGRAVTDRDFESVAESIDGVRKAKALSGRHPDYPNIEVPGAVTVVIVPDSDAKPPLPSAELIRSVCGALDQVRLITTEAYVAAPRFLEIRVETRLFADPQAAFDQVALEAQKRLDEYLSPFKREFGENISPAAIYARLFGSDEKGTPVRSVEDLLLYVDGQPHEVRRPIEIPADALAYPGHHLIVVRPEKDR